MEITYLGHSTFTIKTDKHTLLFDPFISPNELAKDVNIDSLKADYILLSHGHQDHVADVERIYKNNPESILISTFEVASWFEAKGLKNVHPMNHGGAWDFDFGRVKMVNAVHSSVMPDGSYGGNPAGFVLSIENKTLYYAGDTALHLDMKLIGEAFDIDLAFLPIGSNFTMGIEDALRSADFVGAKRIVGMHYDTFPYIKIDHSAAQKMAQGQGKILSLMPIGQRINL